MFNSQLKHEFNNLPSILPSEETNHLFEIANNNKTKNRYNNVLPFDKTIVKMKNLEYINANYIKLTNIDKIRFISTQAPTNETMETFYRMIWEHKVPVIVMLTKCVEKRMIKANCYWPSVNQSENFAEFEITLISESNEDDLIFIRRIKISKGEKHRIITLVQYVEWPDHGTPNNSKIIRKLIDIMEKERVNNSLSLENDHIVVHCSAGIGRTGTFLAIYSALHYFDSCGIANIHEIVKNLRDQRMLMVQSFEQYTFIYKVLDEYNNSICLNPLTCSLC